MFKILLIMKKIFIPLFLLLFSISQAQISRFSGGLGFSTGIDYNVTSTGNPAVFGKAYLELSRRFHIIPGLMVFNKGEDGSTFSDNIRKNYMFMVDVDAQYGILKEDQLTLVAFGGLNMTGIASRIVGGNTTLENSSSFKPGVNLGAAIEMRINNSYDAVVSGKYILGDFAQGVFNIGIIYHLSRSRGGGRW
jgi:hypothetical protein